MKIMIFFVALSLAAMSVAFSAFSGGVSPAPNGIMLPQGYEEWRMIALSHRSDNNTIRAILGNDIAIKAARSRQTNPWPDGSVLAKIVWKGKSHVQWSPATVPGEFVHAEFMVKDSEQYSSTGGWGFARWVGNEQVPYGKDESFVQECFRCHDTVRENDYVFTRPAILPGQNQVD
jgi:hypothetical protein